MICILNIMMLTRALLGPVNGSFLIEFTKAFPQLSLCKQSNLIFSFFFLPMFFSFTIFFLLSSNQVLFLKNLSCLWYFLFVTFFFSSLVFRYREVANRCTLRQHNRVLWFKHERTYSKV